MAGLPTSIVSYGPKVNTFYVVNNGKLELYTSDYSYLYSYTFAGNIYTVISLTYDGPINCAYDYDGAFFYTASLNSSFIIFTKWLLHKLTNELIPVSVKSYRLEASNYWFDVKGITVEAYRRSLTLSSSAGATYIKVNSSYNFKPGQKLIIGPSSAGSSKGFVDERIINSISGTTIYLDTPLEHSFALGDSCVAVDALAVCSSRGIQGSNVPVVYRLDRDSLKVIDSTTLYHVRSATGCCFLSDLLHVSSDCSIVAFDLNKRLIQYIMITYQQCSGLQTTYGVTALGTELAIVQDSKVEFSNLGCSVVPFSDFGVVTYMLVPFVSIVEVIIDDYISGVYYCKIHVADQYNRGLVNIPVVIISDDPDSTITCSNYNTDVYGYVYFTYIPGHTTVQIITSYTDTTYMSRSQDYVYGRCTIYKSSETFSADCDVEYYSNITTTYDISKYSTEVVTEYDLIVLRRYINTNCYINYIAGSSLGRGHLALTNSGIAGNIKLTCDSNINGTGQTNIFNNATAFVNGPIATTTDIDMFRFLSYFKPKPFSDRNARNSIIDFYIFPAAFKFNTTSFKVEINEVNTYLDFETGWKDVTLLGSRTLIPLGGDRSALQFEYNHGLYKYASRVHVRFSIYDTAAVPNLFQYYCYFDIIPDYKPPEVISIYPSCGSVDVPADTSIVIGVRDVGVGVDVDTITVLIDGISVNHTVYNVNSNYLITVDNLTLLPGSYVNLYVSVKDFNNNLLEQSCKFMVAGSNKPKLVPQDVCGKVVDNRFSFYFDVYDTGGGVKLDTIELILDYRFVDFTKDNILYRVK